MECSALDNTNVLNIFRTFLSLSKINFAPPRMGHQDDESVGLRRNLSAYGRLKSPVMRQKANNQIAAVLGSTGTPGSIPGKVR